MAKVTYLIGAGASAGERDNATSVQGLPIVKDFEPRLTAIIVRLDHMVRSVRGGRGKNLHIYTTAKNDMDFLLRGCKYHASVDTFCKMLYLTNSNDYKKAKYAVILFFELDRFFNATTDKRYDAFFASILKKETPRLPDTINVISWNYDCEFEKAFLNYCHKVQSMEEIYKELNVIHKNNKHENKVETHFGILKINGTIGFYDFESNIVLGLNKWDLFSKSDNDNISRISPLLETYNNYAYEEQYEPMVSFAWDDDQGRRKIKEEIVDALSNTEVLIVIGYSFPYFNRELDRFIFAHIGNARGVVPKIYLQDINAQMLQENVERLRGGQKQIELIENVNQFHIPFELD
jgi:hypothetical protein